MANPKPWSDLGSLADELRKTETPGEALLLVALWSKREKWRPRAQHPVGAYRVDIAIPEAKLAIESDGHRFHSTNEQLEADATRQNALVAEGWTPLRFSAAQAFLRPADVAEQIAKEARKRVAPRRPPPPSAPEQPMDPAVAAAQAQKLLDALALDRGDPGDVFLPRPVRRT